MKQNTGAESTSLLERPHSGAGSASENNNASEKNAPSAVRTDSEGRTGRRKNPFFGFTALLCLFLATVYGAIWAFYPWRPLAELDVPGWIVDFADQVDLMMTRRDPPVVVFGSSLTLAAPRRLANQNVYQEALSSRSGTAVSASVMAVPGAIASDQDFLLTQLLQRGKKPRLVIYTYAPRDFMDNTIEGKISTTPTRKVLNFINRRNSFLPKSIAPADLKQCFDNHVQYLDLVRRHVLRLSRAYACKVSGHPESLWSAAREKAAAQDKQTATALDTKIEDKATETGAFKPSAGAERADETAEMRASALKTDLELYDHRYNPQNSSHIEEQYNHLETLLSTARTNGIGVDLIGMPVSPANLALLKTGVYQSMLARVRGLATKYGADLTDLNTDKNGAMQPQFEQQEFLDSVHLSNAGARHFVPVFAEIVVGSRAFQSAFEPKSKQEKSQ